MDVTPMEFKSLADFKRQLTVGRTVRLTHYQVPERSRQTRIQSAGSANFSLAPRTKAEAPAFIEWPKAAHFEAATGTVFSRNGGPRVRLFSFALLD